MTARLAFIDTDRTRACARGGCSKEFTVRYLSDRKRYCSKACASSDRASKRTSERNSNWRGGKTSHPLYDIYLDMIGRCHRSTHKRYADYGARGITVCERWRADFWAFVNDMGPRPDGLTLDRADNDKGYSPENCRWATYAEQRHNRRPERLRKKCPNGHEYTPENTRTSPEGWQECITCATATRERSNAASNAAKRRNRAAIREAKAA